MTRVEAADHPCPDHADTLDHTPLPGFRELGGGRPVASPGFPAPYKPEATKGAASLARLREAGEDVDWTYLSPAPVILPGERTGSYKVELETPAGEQVSIPDYAVAMVDEIEQPQHVRQRFTVAN